MRRHDGPPDSRTGAEVRPHCRVYDRDSGEWRRRVFRLPPSALALLIYEDEVAMVPILVVPLLAHTVVLFGAVAAGDAAPGSRGRSNAFVMPAHTPRHFDTQGIVVACCADEPSVERFAERKIGDVLALPPVSVALIVDGDKPEVGHWYGALQMAVKVNAGLLGVESRLAPRRIVLPGAMYVVARAGGSFRGYMRAHVLRGAGVRKRRALLCRLWRWEEALRRRMRKRSTSPISCIRGKQRVDTWVKATVEVEVVAAAQCGRELTLLCRPRALCCIRKY